MITLDDKKRNNSYSTNYHYTTDDHSRKISQWRINELTHIQDREPALEEIHREDVENKQQKYARKKYIDNNFYKCFFDQSVDGNQAKQNQTYQKIADKIS